jgi:uncharacterized membrane protein required for colicin V production
MILDIALVVIALIAIATGYNKGALATLLSILGYFGGGVLGFGLANWYSSGWKGLTAIIFLHLFAIFAGANLGRWVLEKSGIGIHKRILFGPFKFINSILGAALSLAQVALIAYVVITLIKYLPWSISESFITKSQIYSQAEYLELLSEFRNKLAQNFSLNRS